MKRLVYRKRRRWDFVGPLSESLAGAMSAPESAAETGRPSVDDVLRERVRFVDGPQPVRPLQAIAADATSDGIAPVETNTSMLDTELSALWAPKLYHGVIENESDVIEALRILGDFEERGEISEYVIESDVRPPPSISASPFAGWKPWPLPYPFRKDFEPHQTYLEDAPVGIGARHAWTFDGGRGEPVTLVDIELGFHGEHEDLQRAAANTPNTPDDPHGTMSLGVCCADENTCGITGIAPGAVPELESVRNEYALMSEYPLASEAIRKCVDRLCAGDVILLELEAKYSYTQPGISGYFSKTLPIERSPDVVEAVAAAERANIYVVEVAANGNLDLRTAGLEAWTGAILVGAGDPDTRARVHGTNHGSRVDVQGWGSRVVSTASSWKDATLSKGLGKKWRNRSYTRTFDGTSSAAAMVAGVVACLSGILQANGYGLLTPKEMRDLLVMTGKPCTGAEWIGPLPDLKAAIARLQADYGPLKLAHAA